MDGDGCFAKSLVVKITDIFKNKTKRLLFSRLGRPRKSLTRLVSSDERFNVVSNESVSAKTRQLVHLDGVEANRHISLHDSLCLWAALTRNVTSAAH